MAPSLPPGSAVRCSPQGRGSVWGADSPPCHPCGLWSFHGPAGVHGRWRAQQRCHPQGPAEVGNCHRTPRCAPVLRDSPTAPGYSVDEFVCPSASLWVQPAGEHCLRRPLLSPPVPSHLPSVEDPPLLSWGPESHSALLCRSQPALRAAGQGHQPIKPAPPEPLRSRCCLSACRHSQAERRATRVAQSASKQP